VFEVPVGRSLLPTETGFEMKPGVNAAEPGLGELARQVLRERRARARQEAPPIAPVEPPIYETYEAKLAGWTPERIEAARTKRAEFKAWREAGPPTRAKFGLGPYERQLPEMVDPTGFEMRPAIQTKDPILGELARGLLRDRIRSKKETGFEMRPTPTAEPGLGELARGLLRDRIRSKKETGFEMRPAIQTKDPILGELARQVRRERRGRPQPDEATVEAMRNDLSFLQRAVAMEGAPPIPPGTDRLADAVTKRRMREGLLDELGPRAISEDMAAQRARLLRGLPPAPLEGTVLASSEGIVIPQDEAWRARRAAGEPTLEFDSEAGVATPAEPVAAPRGRARSLERAISEDVAAAVGAQRTGEILPRAESLLDLDRAIAAKEARMGGQPGERLFGAVRAANAKAMEAQPKPPTWSQQSSIGRAEAALDAELRGAPVQSAVPPRGRRRKGAGQRPTGPMRPPRDRGIISRAWNALMNGWGLRTRSGWTEPDPATFAAKAEGVSGSPRLSEAGSMAQKRGESVPLHETPTMPPPGEGTTPKPTLFARFFDLFPIFTADWRMDNLSLNTRKVRDAVTVASTHKHALVDHSVLDSASAKDLAASYGLHVPYSLSEISRTLGEGPVAGKKMPERLALGLLLEAKGVDTLPPQVRPKVAAVLERFRAGRHPQLQAALDQFRAWYDAFADAQKLPRGRRVKDYMAHVWKRENLIEALRVERARPGITPREKAIIDSRLADLLDTNAPYVPMDVLGTVPDEVQFGNLKERLANLPGYIQDPLEAAQRYAHGAIRKLTIDKHLPQVKELWLQIKDGAGEVDKNGRRVNLHKTAKQFVDTYIKNWLGYADSLELTKDQISTFLPDYWRDPSAERAWISTMKAVNHWMLLGTNPGYAIRNGLVGAANTVAYGGARDSLSAFNLLSEYYMTGKRGLLGEMLSATGLLSDVPHGDRMRRAIVTGKAGMTDLLEFIARGSENQIRQHAAATGLVKAKRAMEWGRQNLDLLRRDPKLALEKLRQLNLVPADTNRYIDAVERLTAALADDGAGKRYLFDEAYQFTQQSQHTYGQAAPTWLRMRGNQLAEMGVLYQSWFTKQINFAVNKLDRQGKIRFATMMMGMGGVSGLPLLQWIYESSPELRSLSAQLLSGQMDDEIPPELQAPLKLLAGGGAGMAGLPNVGSGLGLGSLPGPIEAGLGLASNREEGGKAAKLLGGLAGGPVGGGLTQAAWNIMTAAFGAPPGATGEAIEQAAEGTNWPVRILGAQEATASTKRRFGIEDPSLKKTISDLVSLKKDTWIRVALGTTLEEQASKTYAPNLFRQKKELLGDEDLLIDAAIRRHGGDAMAVMKELDKAAPGRISPERVQNRLIAQQMPKQMWPLWTYEPVGTKAERDQLRRAAGQLKAALPGAKWGPMLLQKLEADIIQSRYEEEIAKGGKSNPAVIHELALQLAQVGRKPKDPTLLRRKQQKFLLDLMAVKAGRRIAGTRKYVDSVTLAAEYQA
jgi:hypothetical protein